MGYLDNITLVFVGSPTDDVNDVSAISAELACRWVTPTYERLEEELDYADLELEDGVAKRLFLDIEAWPFSVLYAASTDTYQDYGTFARLETILTGSDRGGATKYPYKFIKECFAVGSNHAGGRIQRAAEHGTLEDLGSPDRDDYFNSLFPLRIVLDGSRLSPSKEKGGRYTLDFAVKAVYAIQ